MTTYNPQFIESIEFSLRWEGGYTNDPFDPGGATNWGITLGVLSKWWKRLKRDNTPTPEDIKKLTQLEALTIYHEWYWQPCRCSEMHPAVALVVMDAAINQGVPRASKTLQKVVNVKQDGIIGPVTVMVTNSSNPSSVIQDLLARRALHYSSLYNITRYGLGWFRRLFAAQQAALKML